MWTRLALALALLLLGAFAFPAEETTANLLKEIRTAKGTAAQPAWEKLVARGPAALPQLLDAMDTGDTVAANWLRTAFDQIVADARKQGGKGLDADALLQVVQDVKRQGRVRRLALEVVEELRPGAMARLLPHWLHDPEFRFEAVAARVEHADALAKAVRKDEATATYRAAFAACRDVTQAQTLAARLKPLGVSVRLAEHFGFLTDWYVLGPFDGRGQKGFRTVYPPEEKVDLAVELPGKVGNVKWQRYQVKEATAGAPARVALVNLVEPFGVVEDGVAYAWTRFTVAQAGTVEFRGAADDNFIVWVNGQRAFGFEEYRNGVRLDRHRFKVQLNAGANTVLVKICQATADPNRNEPNWEFLLRVVDATGKGIDLKNDLPAKKE